MTIELVGWLIGAYLVGAIPVGVIIGRIRGVDLREVGSGNIGATNAVRALGRKWGLLVFGLDVAKAALPVSLALARFGNGHGAAAVGLVAIATILGHVFPIYLRFAGGKGVACALGVFLVLAPAAALLAMAVYLQTLLLTRVSAMGSLTATSVMVGVVWLDPALPRAWKWCCLFAAAVVWWRHRENVAQMFGDDRAPSR